MAGPEGNYCDRSNQFALHQISVAVPELVLIAQEGQHDWDHFQRLTDHLKGLGVARVMVTGPAPHWTRDLPQWVVARWHTRTPRMWQGVNQFYIDVEAEFASSQPAGIEYFSVMDRLCNDDGCLVAVGDDYAADITSWDYGI